MVDLKAQHSPFQKELDEAVLNALHNTQYINGPEVKTFANNLNGYLGSGYTIPCANGTDALQIGLMALGLKPGDEVIVPSFNYVAAVEAIALLQLKPVFVEVDKLTYNIDIEDLQKRITPKTKAIVAIHLFGLPASMTEIMEIANTNNIAVIEDNAQSLGSEVIFKGTKKKAGTIGTLSTTSFFPTKNLGCAGDGGAVFTNDEELAKRIKMVSSHGQSKKYHFECVGINSRLDTIQAAILDIRLKHLDSNLESRKAIAARYSTELANTALVLPVETDKEFHTYNQFTVQVENRDVVSQKLNELGIPNMIYYPIPVHLQNAYTYLGYKKGSLHVSEDLCTKVLSIPVHPALLEDQQTFIIDSIKKILA